MRLLLVIEEENLGGAELSFLELSRALAARSEVHLALSQGAQRAHSAVYDGLSRVGIQVHACSRSLYPGTVANLHPLLRRGVATELARVVERSEPAVVLVNLPTVERGQSVVDAVRGVSPRLPVWGLLHLVQPPSKFGARLGPVRDLMVESLLERFDRLITVSRSGALYLAGRYGLHVPAVLHPPTAALEPVLSDGDRQRQRSGHNLPQGFLLGIVGRVQVRQKGQDAALRVLARLLGDGLPVHLVMIGDGPDLPAVRTRAQRMGIDSNVSFMGWRHDAGSLIPLLDALLLPSHFEGLPQTALQAASARVPVFAYDVDGLREFLPAGFRVPHGDEQGLADAILKVAHGTLVWPSDEMATRALTWGDPGLAADRLLGLLRQSSP